MKPKWEAWTDYPMLDGDQCKLRKVRIVDYDDNKYCHVKPYDDNGNLVEDQFSVKIGYIKMDSNLTRKPDIKSASAWAGHKRAPKRRVSKSSYDVFVELNDGSRVNFKSLNGLSTYVDAEKAAEKLFNKNHPLWKDYPEESEKLSLVLIWKSYKTFSFSTNCAEETVIEKLSSDKSPVVIWKGRWKRYFGRKK